MNGVRKALRFVSSTTVMPVQQLEILLLLYSRGKAVTYKEIGEELGQTPSQVSRNVLMLSYRIEIKNGKEEPRGYDFVIARKDYYEPRNMAAELKPKGIEFCEHFHSLLGGGSGVSKKWDMVRGRDRKRKEA